MSGEKHYYLCDLDQELNVRLHLDEDGDMFISVIRHREVDYESVLLTKEDAAEMADVLKRYSLS